MHSVVFESAIKGGKKTEEMVRSEWWTASDGRELEEAVEKAKQGLLFLGIKSSSVLGTRK
jgi:RNA exonuclease 1